MLVDFKSELQQLLSSILVSPPTSIARVKSVSGLLKILPSNTATITTLPGYAPTVWERQGQTCGASSLLRLRVLTCELPWWPAACEGPCLRWICERSAWYEPLQTCAYFVGFAFGILNFLNIKSERRRSAMVQYISSLARLSQRYTIARQQMSTNFKSQSLQLSQTHTTSQTTEQTCLDAAREERDSVSILLFGSSQHHNNNTPFCKSVHLRARRTTKPNLILPLHLKLMSALLKFRAHPLQHSTKSNPTAPFCSRKRCLRTQLVVPFSVAFSLLESALTELSTLQAREEPRGTGRF
jgi:hypothetical protein